MLEDFHFKNGEDPLEVLKHTCKSVVVLLPFVFVVWSMVGFYNWAS